MQTLSSNNVQQTNLYRNFMYYKTKICYRAGFRYRHYVIHIYIHRHDFLGYIYTTKRHKLNITLY